MHNIKEPTEKPFVHKLNCKGWATLNRLRTGHG